MNPTPIFDAKTVRLLTRLGLGVGVVVVLLVVFGLVRKFLKKSNTTTVTTNGTNPDGTPTTLPSYTTYHIDLADRLKKALGWVIVSDENRCKTIQDFDALGNSDLYLVSIYYKKTYSQSLYEAFNSMYRTGCWSGGEGALASILDKTEKGKF